MVLLSGDSYAAEACEPLVARRGASGEYHFTIDRTVALDTPY